jgi:homogentisate phytyltransferase/homogentisate geranylgeranyltransferase
MLSILTIYFILCGNNKSEHASLLILTLLAGVCCNIFIVGLNQVADVHIDKINKPWLPLASGELNIRHAKIIVILALFSALSLAWYITPYFFFLLAFSAIVGWCYSMPPFHFKRHHLPAAMAISVVRGLVINIGGFLVFRSVADHGMEMPGDLMVLTIFAVLFGFVIAWFKDLPDVKGDARHNIKSLAVLYSIRTAFVSGLLLSGVAYAFTIFINGCGFLQARPREGSGMLLFGNILLVILFFVSASTVRLADKGSLKRFYKRFWWFFFAEYVLYFHAHL